MLLLISPSKTQDFAPMKLPGKLAPSMPQFLPKSTELITALRKYSPSALQDLMDISEKLATLNHQRYRGFSVPFTADNAKPAAYAFRGDVYDGLDADSFTARQLAFAQSSLRMLSGLYGMLKPLDLIQPYRLEMSIPLKVGKHKNLYQFWGSDITYALNAELESTGHKAVVNLASQEYSTVIQPKEIQGKWINVHFKEERGNQLKVIALFAKQARGAFAGYVIRHGIKSVSKLADFSESGYRFRDDLSTATDLVFARKGA